MHIQSPNYPAVRLYDASGNLIGLAHTLQFDSPLTAGTPSAGVSEIGLTEVWKDLRVPMSSMKLGTANPPDLVQVSNNGAGSVGVDAYGFDQTLVEHLRFSVQLPHEYKVGSDLKPHVHWTTKDPAASGVVRWGIEYTVANVGGYFGQTSIIYADSSSVDVADHLKHRTTLFSDLSGSSLNLSAMLLCRIFRDASNAADTFNADALLLEVDFHYLVDALGSTDPFTK